MSDVERTAGQWWQSGDAMVSASLHEVRTAALNALVDSGANPADAAYIADIHLDKALQGDHARGIRMLMAQVRAARSGELDFNPDIRILKETGATALVDGGAKASGKLVCRHAMDLAIRKAAVQGVGWVGARARAEILTPFVQQAVDQGMIGMVMGQSIPTVAPMGGFRPLLGNAPMAWGIPTRNHAPVILDTCLTQTSGSGVAMAAEQGERIPEGFVLDSSGAPSTNPDDLYDPAWSRQGRHVARGSLLPIGNSHKSYAQIFVIGLLTTLLTNTDFSWNLANDLSSTGRFGAILVAIDPSAFVTDAADFTGLVDEYIEFLKSSPRSRNGGEILYPGERSRQLRRSQSESGLLMLPEADYRALMDLSTTSRD